MHIAVRGVRLQPDLQGRWRSLWVRLNADATHDTDPKNGIAAFPEEFLMTTRAIRDAKRTAAPRKKKLTLSKKTLSDLTPGRRQGGAIRGGANRTNTCGCL